MESFLLICNVALMGLIVVLTLLDENRKPGAPRSSPFRINEKMISRAESNAKPPPYLRTRRRRS